MPCSQHAMTCPQATSARHVQKPRERPQGAELCAEDRKGGTEGFLLISRSKRESRALEVSAHLRCEGARRGGKELWRLLAL